MSNNGAEAEPWYRDIPPKDIQYALGYLEKSDYERLGRLPLVNSMLTLAYLTTYMSDTTLTDETQRGAKAIRQILRGCWKVWVDRVNDALMDLDGINEEDTVVLLTAVLYSGVRYGLAPGRHSMSPREYDAWASKPSNLLNFLHAILYSPIPDPMLRNWVEQMGMARWGRARLRMRDVLDIALNRWPSVPPLVRLRNELDDPELDCAGWDETVSELETYLDAECRRGRATWVTEVLCCLVGKKVKSVSLEWECQRFVHESLASLRKKPERFFKAAGGSTASYWLSKASSALAVSWNEYEIILANDGNHQLQGEIKAAKDRMLRKRTWMRRIWISVVLVGGISMAMLVAAFNGWIDQIVVLQGFEEILKLAEQYPQVPIQDAFTWGITWLYLWIPVLLYLVCIIVLQPISWYMERQEERRINELRQWKHRPQAYMEHAVREGRISLPEPLASALAAIHADSQKCVLNE